MSIILVLNKSKENTLEEKKYIKNPLYDLLMRHGYDSASFAIATGITRPNISLYSSGKSVPSSATINKMAEILGIDTNVIVDTLLECKEYADRKDKS